MNAAPPSRLAPSQAAREDVILVGRSDPRRAGGLHAQVQTRGRAVVKTSANLEVELVEAAARLEALRSELEQVEAQRRIVMRNAARFGDEAVVTVSERCLALAEELGREEGQVSGIGERVAGLTAERSTLEEVGAHLSSIGDADDHDRVPHVGVRVPRQLLDLADAELDRLDNALQEGPVQHLAGLAFELEVLSREVERGLPVSTAVRERAVCANDSLRLFLGRLHPAGPDAVSLLAAVRSLMNVYEAEGLRVSLTVTGRQSSTPPRVTSVVCRIVELALENVRRHANVDRASVGVTFAPTRVSLVVRDEGEGFDLAATDARQGRARGLGLLMMRERAALESGVLEVHAAIGIGTEVRLSLPL